MSVSAVFLAQYYTPTPQNIWTYNLISGLPFSFTQDKTTHLSHKMNPLPLKLRKSSYIIQLAYNIFLFFWGGGGKNYCGKKKKWEKKTSLQY